VFRLDEPSHDDYKHLVMSQDPLKMNVFLQFLYNTDELKKNVREKWCQELDAAYIDEKVIGVLQKNLSGVNDIMANVEKKATGRVVQTTSLSGTLTESKRIFNN
jgi:hypothetical protein